MIEIIGERESRQTPNSLVEQPNVRTVRTIVEPLPWIILCVQIPNELTKNI